jgi:hypothetical protein
MRNYPVIGTGLLDGVLARYPRIVPLSDRDRQLLCKPHQGKQEAARRRQQLERKAAKSAARAARSADGKQ